MLPVNKKDLLHTAEAGLSRYVAIHNMETTTNTILGRVTKDGNKVITSMSCGRNSTCVFGSPASGKTWCYALPYILQAARRKESMIITDGTGELFEKSSGYLRSLGYSVRVLNLSDPEKTQGLDFINEPFPVIFTSKEEAILTAPGNKLCAYYCVLDSKDAAQNELAASFISLLSSADVFNQSGSVSKKIKINFILDEFCSIGKIPNITKKLKYLSSIGDSISILTMNIDQIHLYYPDEADDILDMCDTIVCLDIFDTKTMRYIADRWYKRQKESHQAISPDGSKSLFNLTDDIHSLRKDKCLILSPENNACTAYKFPVSIHPDFFRLHKTPINYSRTDEKEEIEE